jgi:hypothetical protein
MTPLDPMQVHFISNLNEHKYINDIKVAHDFVNIRLNLIENLLIFNSMPVLANYSKAKNGKENKTINLFTIKEVYQPVFPSHSIWMKL